MGMGRYSMGSPTPMLRRPPHQRLSNGLQITIQRALEPNLGHYPAQARSCRSQIPLAACRTPKHDVRPVFVQVAARHDHCCRPLPHIATTDLWPPVISFDDESASLTLSPPSRLQRILIAIKKRPPGSVDQKMQTRSMMAKVRASTTAKSSKNKRSAMPSSLEASPWQPQVSV